MQNCKNCPNRAQLFELFNKYIMPFKGFISEKEIWYIKSITKDGMVGTIIL